MFKMCSDMKIDELNNVSYFWKYSSFRSITNFFHCSSHKIQNPYRSVCLWHMSVPKWIIFRNGVIDWKNVNKEFSSSRFKHVHRIWVHSGFFHPTVIRPQSLREIWNDCAQSASQYGTKHESAHNLVTWPTL